jgi:hypothetical protein
MRAYESWFLVNTWSVAVNRNVYKSPSQGPVLALNPGNFNYT